MLVRPEDGSRECDDKNARLEGGSIDEDEDHVIVDAAKNGHANNLIGDEGEVEQLLAIANPEVLGELEVVLQVKLFARKDLAQDATHEEMDNVI